MAREQYFVVGFTLDPEFTVSQMSRVQGGIDINVVFSWFKLVELTLGQAKAPVLLVVGSPVGDPVRVFRNREQVGPKFRQRHGPVYRSTVIQYMQV